MRAPTLVSAVFCVAGCVAHGAVGQSTLLPNERLSGELPPGRDAGAVLWSSPAVEAGALRGLVWLASTQTEPGCWVGDIGHKQGDWYQLFYDATARRQRELGQGHIGVTSLAALAFLAGGHLPDRGKYGKPVRRALDYVLARVEDNGYITEGRSRMYSHAFASLFLAQVYGMVGESRIKHALERAVHWVVDCQNRQGGWRYNPFSQEADLSVTVCQLQALRAARNIGIRVPKQTIERAAAYVMRARTDSSWSRGLFYYKTQGRGAWQKNRQYAINAAAVTSLFSAGVYDRATVEPALTFLEEDYPRLTRRYRQHFYYWYGNYYASQAFFQAGGARFESYYRTICADLLDDQQSDGRWINDTGPGDPFATAVACLILQISKQYLPIFQR